MVKQSGNPFFKILRFNKKEKTMSKVHVSRSIILYLALFLIGVLISPFLTTLLPMAKTNNNQSALAQAGSADAVPAGVNSPEEPMELFTCNPDFVGELINRVHVHCTSPAAGTIYWFATPTSDAKRAARVYSLMLTAIAAGKNVRIYYDSTADGTAFGCSYSDCRPINYIEIVK
jgi:hypothetical protein